MLIIGYIFINEEKKHWTSSFEAKHIYKQLSDDGWSNSDMRFCNTK